MEQIITTDELQPGDQQSVFVDDVPALVVRDGDEYLVVEDVCSHDGQPLADGEVSDGAIACPRHGAKFDLRTGAAMCMPATQPIRTFAVEVRGNEVWAGVTSSTEETKPAATAATSAKEVITQPVVAASDAAEGSADETTSDSTAGDGTPSTDSDYLEALKQVIDPELMINIVDLGLIYAVEAEEEGAKVNVDMTLTSPACPAGPQLVQQAKMALERLHDVSEAGITLVMSPPWTPERMTDDARDQLGIF